MSKAELTESKLDDQLIPLINRAGKTLVWILGVVFILQNMGVQVTALVAFGSVGGVAIALASKDTVENLFGSLVVFIDQPFQIGDYVIIDGSIEGAIEEVGFPLNSHPHIRKDTDIQFPMPKSHTVLSITTPRFLSDGSNVHWVYAMTPQQFRWKLL